MTIVEIVQLKQLITTRNNLNKKMEASNGTSSIVTYRHGIRNERVVKVALEKKTKLIRLLKFCYCYLKLYCIIVKIKYFCVKSIFGKKYTVYKLNFDFERV